MMPRTCSGAISVEDGRGDGRAAFCSSQCPAKTSAAVSKSIEWVAFIIAGKQSCSKQPPSQCGFPPKRTVRDTGVWELGIWSFSGCWSLVLGASLATPKPRSSTSLASNLGARRLRCLCREFTQRAQQPRHIQRFLHEHLHPARRAGPLVLRPRCHQDDRQARAHSPEFLKGVPPTLSAEID